MSTLEGFEGVYIVEPISKYLRYLFKVSRIHALEKTPYQEVVLAEIEGLGRSLILDKFIQSAEKDEYMYHELLVHPAMCLHPHPERVLILGGGEGATLREVLKHNTVREAIMVDIDPVVVEFSKRYLEHMHRNSFNDPRAKVIIMDGKDYVKQTPSSYFDVVIMDLTDPYASEIAKPLYSPEAFREIRRVLRDDGVVVTQAGSSYFYPDEYKWVLGSVKSSFKYISEYWFWVPSFGLNVNFVVASNVYRLEDYVNTIDERLRERGVTTRLVSGRFIDGLLKIGVLYP